MSLAKRHAVVTGSTSGIGLAIARALAREGADVMINGFGDAKAIEAERAAIENEFGVKCVYSGADMSKGAEVEAMIADATAKLGTVDILVNNAGIQFVSPIEEFPPEKWDAILAINLSSAFHTIRAAVPGMKAQKWGRIVNTASAHSLVASPFKSAYVSAKHGLAGLTKTVALELATFGVTCNCISPGYVWTPLVENQIPDTMKARNMTREQVINDVLLVAQPTKQFVTVDQVASLAVYLCSDAAAQITGREPVDRRRLDGGVKRPRNGAGNRAKPVNLALQGGGSHGAYSWGVLDAFAEDTRLDIVGISGASAGAMNAVVYAAGLAEAGRAGARTKLETFWLSVSTEGSLAPAQRKLVDAWFGAWGRVWPGTQWLGGWADAVSQFVSPYALNPFNVNPLRDHLVGRGRLRPPAAERRPQAVRRRDQCAGLAAARSSAAAS